MKTKILTTICTLMIPIPWTILYLRSFAWALESPAAEITISCYYILFPSVIQKLFSRQTPTSHLSAVIINGMIFLISS